MDTVNPTEGRLRAAVTAILNAHDLLDVLGLGAPADEYDPEMKDLVSLLQDGTVITPEVVAAVWHKWFGDPSEPPAPPTPEMVPLASDLQATGSSHGH